MLTAGIDNGAAFTGGTGADNFNATHLTMGASDVLVGGAGVDTLTIVDTGTAAYAPAFASVSGIENINLRNLNGSAAVSAVREVATVNVPALLAGQTLVVAGQTLTATADITAATAAAALAGTATSGTGWTLAGTLTGYTKAAGGTTNTVAYTDSATNASNITDLAVSGTAQSAIPQVSKLLISTAAADAGGAFINWTFTYNGTTVTTNNVAVNASAATQAGVIADAINVFSGKTIATADGAGGVVVISSTPVSLATFTAVATDGALATAPVRVYGLAPKSKVVTISTDATATTGTFTYNGVSYTTATAGAATAVAAATAFVAKINEVAGATIASNVAGTSAAITINNGATGVAIDNFAYTGSTFAETSIVSSTGAIAASPASVSVVQGVAAAASATQTDTVDATKFTDATTFTSDASTGQVDFTGLTAAQTAVKKAGAGGMGAGFGATVTAGTVEINGGSTAGNVAITGAALTTATINSTGAANTIGTLTGAATTTTSTTINATTALTTGAATNLGATVTVNGAGNVSFGTTALEAGVTTLNAAGLTGTLTVALGSAVTQKVTGGSGADVISTGAVLTTGSVDAGVGTDVLVLTNATHLASPTLAAKYTNFETLRINTGITQDMANAPASITAVQTMGVATVSNMTPAQAAAVQMRTNATAGTADNMAFSLASQTGTSDTLTIVAGVGTTTTGALDIGTLNVTGFEILNIQANPGPSSTAGAGAAGDKTTAVGALTGATLNTINLTGTAVNFSDIATTVPVTINGSALTGDGLAAASQAGLTVAGNAVAGSTINGSAVRDVFTIGAEGSAYNGGAGNDRMTTTVAILVADGVTDGSMNGGDGTDTLVVSDTTGNTLTDNHFTKLSNFEALTLTNTGAGDTRITTGVAFNSAFATGATITSGVIAATQDIEIAAGLATVPVTVSIAATSQTGAATEINIITTGSAADSVTYTDTDFVGVNAATAQGQIIVDTRGGNDTIAVTVGTLLGNSNGTDTAVVITGGAGKDTITKVGTNGAGINGVAHYVMAAGDSSISARDVITGFDVADGTAFSDLLNFEGTATVTAFSNSIDFGTILTHSVTGGIVTFDTAATFAAAKIVNANNLADVLGYLNANMGVNETAGFLFDSNGDGANDATMVFHQGSSLTTVADDVVELVGITGLSLNATTNTTTAGAIIIA
jgi:S-layer protein